MGRRVFISYQHDDIQQAKGFNLLRWNRYVDFDFVGRHLLSPANSSDPTYIRRRIREEIHGTSTTVVLIGNKTSQSDWVDFEIKESLQRGSGVIGIRLKGAENAKVPPALEESGCKVIDWAPDTFEDEIEGACLIAGRPELEPPSVRSAKPTSCIR